MKKLMIIAAAVLCGTFVRAASVNWGVEATSSDVGYSVYMVSAISDAWTSAADVATDAAKLGGGTSGTIAKNGRKYSISDQTAAGAGITSSASLYLVLVKSADATGYTYVSMGDISGAVYEPPASATSTFSTTSEALLAGTAGTFGSSPVPEPTSGLLMLLGMAGLALRRRRA